jgi:hypothetical protein
MLTIVDSWQVLGVAVPLGISDWHITPLRFNVYQSRAREDANIEERHVQKLNCSKR